MNKKTVLIVVLTILASLTLTACSPQMMGVSWPGVTVDQDTIYLAMSQQVMAVRVDNGSLIWRYPEKAEARRLFFAPPEVANGQVIAGDYLNTLHALNRESGIEAWNFTQAKGRFVGGALVVGDTLMVPNGDHSLYALDKNGKLLWSYKTGNALWARPVSDGKTVFFPSMDHKMYAVDVTTGKEVWSADLGGAVTASPALTSDGTLLVGTLSNELLALDAASGKVLWRFATQAAVWATPITSDGSVYFGDLSGSVYAIDSAKGTQIWKADQIGKSIDASGVLTPNGMIFVSEDGNVAAFGFKGERLWTKTVKGQLYTAPVLSGERVIVAVTSGENLMVAFDLSGNEQWQFVLPK